MKKHPYVALVLLALFAGATGRAMAASNTASPTPSPTQTPGASVAALDLQGACSFAVLGSSGIAKNGTSNITGNVGSYPTASESGTGSMVIGGGADHGADGASSAAQSGLTAAYGDGSTRPGTTIGGALEGDGTIYPGVYTSLSGAFTLAAADTLTLDGNGDTSSVFIFQTTAAMTTGASTIISLVNGAQAQNVFWVIGSDATLGASSTFSGTILAAGAVTVGANAAVTGRLLAEGGLVTLDSDTITNSFACAGGSPTFTPTLGGSITYSPTPAASGSVTSSPTPTDSGSVTSSSTPTDSGSTTASSTPTDSGSTTATFTPSITVSPTTGPSPVSPLPVSLQGADGYSILAGSGITNTGASSSSGYVGTFPTASETGFGSLNQACTNYAGGTFTQSAKTDLNTAYLDAQGRTATAQVGTELGGTTLPTGVYDSAAGTFGITGTLTLDGGGNTNSVFIFQAASTLITANNSVVLLTNGAQAKNVFWAVGSSATLGTGSTFVGTILAYTAITVNTGCNITGRLLALNAAVTVDSSSINTASVSQAPCNTVTATSSPTPGGSTTASPSPTAGGSTTSSPTPTAGGSTTSSPTPTAGGSTTSSPSPTAGGSTATSTHTPAPGSTFTSTRTPTPGSSVTALASHTAGPAPAAWPNSYFYPSPAKGDAGAVAYDLRQAGVVTLRVYNQTGRLVDTVHDSKPAGWQASRVNVSRFASGVYYYILYLQYSADGTSETQAPRKFVVAH